MSTSAAQKIGPTCVRESGLTLPIYEPSELGAIPEDWKVLDVGDLRPFVTSGSRGWAQYYSDLGAPFLRITNLSRQSVYVDLIDLKLVDLPSGLSEANRTLLKDGDVLVSITADIGIIGYVDSRVLKPAYINQHIALVRFDGNKTDAKFVSYFLASERPQRIFRGLTDQGAKAGMSLLTIRKLTIVQPEIEEQREIAEKLSDADALISALEKLIAKKRAIKLSVMQQLLTGRTRLQGFDTIWSTMDFESLFRRLNCKVHQIQASEYEQHGSYPVIDQGQQEVIAYSNRSDKLFHCPVGGVIVFGDHTRIVKYICRDFLIGADGTQVLVSRDENVTKFLYYLLSAAGIPNAGYARHFKFLKDLSFSVPEPDEQGIIASLLTDMDDEIAALERRCEKTKAIKQGMMQALLTGRIRLV
jgi:type I restriction enzyme S subunit